MAVRIRLSRFGRIHRPFFRIVAIDGRCHREGKANEVLGTYDPALPDGKAIQVQMERVEAWAKQGAQVSTALINLFQHHQLVVPAVVLATASAQRKGPAKKKDPKKWVPPTRRALQKHAAKLKAERKVKTAEEKVKHTAAKAAAKAAETPAEKPADAAPAQA